MNTFLWMLASTAVGWFVGTRTTKQQIDERFHQLEEKLAASAAEKSAAGASVPEPRLQPAVQQVAHPVAAPAGEIPEEVLLVISAAVAAFLGKRARIRRVRRVPMPGFNPWSQQGRVYIQGSHNIWARHGE
jgi:methylmalonyl-CoA carboxyltransferase large subunit